MLIVKKHRPIPIKIATGSLPDLEPAIKISPGNTKLSMVSLKAAIIPKMNVKSSIRIAENMIAIKKVIHTVK